MKIKRGSTSVRRLIFIADSSSTTGAGLASLVYNSAGLVAYYYAGDLSDEVAITLATATLGTFTSSGFVAVDNTNMPGWYEIGIPNAALDGGNEVAIQLRGATNMVPVNIYIELDAVDYQTDAMGALKPTTAGRTLDVSAGGEAGIDWANVGSPTTALALTGTTIATTQKVDVETIKTQAVTCAAGVTVPSSIASPTNITAGTITTVTNLTNLPAITSNWLTAAGLASDAVTEIQSGLATSSALSTVAGYLDTEVAAILADTNELQTDLVNGGRLDLLIDAIKAKTDQFVFTVANQVDANALSGAGGLDAAGIRSAVGLASANLDTQLSTIDTVVDSILVDTAEIGAAGAGLTALASQSSVTTIDDFLDTEIAAIKAKTDNLPTDPSDQSAIEAAITAATSPLATASNLATVAGYLDTEIAAIKAVTDAIGATGSGLTNIPWNAAWDTEVQSECADALAALVIEGSLDLVEVMKVLLAFAAGKTDITGSTYTFRDQADTLNRISATVTAGERTAVTLNVT